jgi:hypothetical protein
MASFQAEAGFLPIVAARADCPLDNYEVRPCAAATLAAVRVVDEEICSAAITCGRTYEPAEVIDQLATAIRAACILPICDPMPPRMPVAPRRALPDP